MPGLGSAQKHIAFAHRLACTVLTPDRIWREQTVQCYSCYADNLYMFEGLTLMTVVWLWLPGDCLSCYVQHLSFANLAA